MVIDRTHNASFGLRISRPGIGRFLADSGVHGSGISPRAPGGHDGAANAKKQNGPRGAVCFDSMVAGAGFLIRQYVLDVTPKSRRRT